MKSQDNSTHLPLLSPSHISPTRLHALNNPSTCCEAVRCRLSPPSLVIQFVSQFVCTRVTAESAGAVGQSDGAGGGKGLVDGGICLRYTDPTSHMHYMQRHARVWKDTIGTHERIMKHVLSQKGSSQPFTVNTVVTPFRLLNDQVVTFTPIQFPPPPPLSACFRSVLSG